jgi:hypothetical protein
MSKAMKTCPNCHGIELARIARCGFMQVHVYPKFRIFPWKCGACRQMFLLKGRGRRYRKAGPRADIGVAQRRPSSDSRVD